MKKYHSTQQRLDCHVQVVSLLGVDNSQHHQFLGYRPMEQDLKIATLKNEMMYRPTNKFNINDSIRQCSFSQSPEASKSTRRSRKERFPPNGLKLQLQLTDSSVDTSSETNTVLSSRSLYSHAMEQNSLFQLRDNDSIEQYIAQITEREKIDDQESDKKQSNLESGS